MSYRVCLDTEESQKPAAADKAAAQNSLAGKQARTEAFLKNLKERSPLAYGYAMAIDALMKDAGGQ